MLFQVIDGLPQVPDPGIDGNGYAPSHKDAGFVGRSLPIFYLSDSASPESDALGKRSSSRLEAEQSTVERQL